ncbi:penicillin-binding protein 2 [Kordiimonas sediminis]|nr:penicillin-binding protein 2 [Kordiimonas sediminis]
MFSRRAFIVGGVQAVCMSILGGRLYYLSIKEGDKYKLRADKNRISLRLIAPERGEILDRKGRRLATNKKDFRVFLIPEQTSDLSATLKEISGIIDLEEKQIVRIERQIKRQRKFVPVTLKQNLNWSSFSRINAEMHDLPGILPDAGVTRDYPAGKSVSHLVGYVASPGEDDVSLNPLYQLPGFKVGREGLERRFEDHLRGMAGTRRVEVNSVGREIRELPGRERSEAGGNVALTIDLELQEYATERLGEASAGAVVMSVETGEIHALASAPTFDPNAFTQGMSVENWNALLSDPRKPLLNKSLAGVYPPGSTIKMVVALAALEKGIITPETEFFCNGRHGLGKQIFHCWRRGGHGKLDLLDAIGQSCDVYFYKIAEQMDIDDLADMARRFGLGQAFDIDLEGVRSGLVPDRRWKRAVMNQPWYLGETLNVSIGQGAFLATPLQLAVMTSRIASGREIMPRLTRQLLGVGELPAEDRGIRSDFRSMDVNPLHMRSARRGMEKVMELRGSAHDYRRAKDMPKQAGKTGTAQVRRITLEERRTTGVLDNEDLPWNARDHALFVGYAPVEDPKFAVAVLVQHGGGGAKVAAPIGRDLMDKALEILNRKPAALSEGEQV